jgi:phosphatidylglycerophosphatase A
VAAAIVTVLAYVVSDAFQLSPWWWLAFAAGLFSPACWAATGAEQYFGRRDPGHIVVDEIVGQCIALAPAAIGNPADWIAAFLLFRIFDIWKPLGLRRLERLPRGYGVVADDAGAGLCAMIVLSSLKGFSLL